MILIYIHKRFSLCDGLQSKSFLHFREWKLVVCKIWSKCESVVIQLAESKDKAKEHPDLEINSYGIAGVAYVVSAKHMETIQSRLYNLL